MNNEKIYIINYYKLVTWLTPNRLKHQRLIGWVKSLIYPFSLLYNAFRNFRKAKLYQLMITPQKCYLERLLNDRYDYTLRRIYIDDGVDKNPYYIYRSDELKPRYLRTHAEAAPKYIYTSGESGILRDDFTVFVPVVILFEIAEMISLVKVYKLAGIKFKIQTFI